MNVSARRRSIFPLLRYLSHSIELLPHRPRTTLFTAGDAVFTHYSGHGGKLRDEDGDEEDGFDETLVPLDYHEAGQIRDDTLYKELVGALPTGVVMTSVMDCCQ